VLLVTINAADLAASGADPIGFVCAIDCPSTLEQSSLERLLSGIRDSCDEQHLVYCGGNLRESAKIIAVGTALGSISDRLPLTREGAAPGDLIVSVGRAGLFWRDAMRVRKGLAVDKRSPLYAPKSQIEPMRLLARERLIHAAMDNSDGLLPTLEEICKKNNATVTVDMEWIKIWIDDLEDCIPNFCFGWGDWNVIATMRETDLPEASKIAAAAGSSITPIGILEPGEPAVHIRSSSQTILAPRLESERFASDSWFSEGIDGYIRRLVGLNLPLS
jgi:thiamine-monophosphate kinase